MLLGDILSNQPLEVLEGKKVIEVRHRGISKGAVGAKIAAEVAPGATLVAIGDDVTDDELFRVLPATALTVAVGPRISVAKFHLDDHRAARRVLRRLLERTDSLVAGRSGASAFRQLTA
jgi:trehalose 6-phosphate synthase/phosphatase